MAATGRATKGAGATASVPAAAARLAARPIPGVGRHAPTDAEAAWLRQLGHNLRSARLDWCTRHGLLLSDLVVQAGVSHNAYYGYERGAVCPSAMALAKLAAVLEVGVESLIPPGDGMLPDNGAN